jgi:sugar phosphate isomerase/epimerase
MSTSTRRDFLKLTLAASAAGFALNRGLPLQAAPFGLPIGLELYSVRELLPKDFEGTLKQIAAAGYTEVEAAGFYDRSAKGFRQTMDNAKLRCVAAHYPLAKLQPQLGSLIEYAKELGIGYMVCASPSLRDPSKVKLSPKDPGYQEAWVQAFTMDDWKWNADQFNMIGKKVQAAGIQFGYHNHTTEFRKLDEVVPYDELMRLTDPALVTYEMDCGWVSVAGYNPADYLKKYPTRISMVHVKDFDLKSGTGHPKSTELGRGTIDYRAIFAAAKPGQLKHAFVEQEDFDMPPLQALKIDAEYMKNLKV